MEVTEAVEILGLDEHNLLGAEQLKRSYLRKVRQHPPERDPDGFQRVRQAYELLQQQALGLLTSSGYAPRPELPSTPSPERPEPDMPTPAAHDVSQPLEPASASASDALPRLRSAIRESKWVTAGNALLELYADASLLEQLPPPEIALRISLELFESGKHKTARRVFEAFKAHMSLHRALLGGASASVWKLLAELSELSRAVDPALTCALAESIRSGAFQEAAPELRAEMAQYGADSVTALMKARAPTLFAATWPYARPPEQRKKRSIRVHLLVQFSMFGLFALYRVIVSLTDSPSPSGYMAPAAAIAQAGPARRFRERASVVSASDALKLQDITSKIEKLAQSGQCDATHAAWVQYLDVASSLGNAPSVRQGYAFRRALVVRACPTLDTELPEEP